MQAAQIVTFWAAQVRFGMSDQGVTSGMVRRGPRGVFTAKVDVNGRVKMPAKYIDYFKTLEDQTLYVTFFQGLPRIFTNGSWERNLEKLAGDPILRKKIAFYCDSVGGDVDLDQSGRLTLPVKLREVARLTEMNVQLRFYQDVITIYPEAVYEQEFAQVVGTAAADQDRAVSLGMGIDL